MLINTDKKAIEELLTRGVTEVINREHLEKALGSGKQLRIKLGIDPTSPNIHLGRAVCLFKLRDFQKLGHKVVFLIGDFTGIIGDTSDKDSERPMLSEEIVQENMKSYVAQAGKILDLDQVEVRNNSEWLSKLGYKEITEQANIFSISDFIARENIKKRLDAGKHISLREVLYPLMQGYDSVAVKADVELGGTDQRFNLLSGRALQAHYGQEPQDFVMTSILPGTDGRKMSSSWGNTINLTDSARDMFGKLMSIPDNLIMDYFIHVTRVEMDKIAEYEKQLKSGANPRDIKMILAETIVEMFYSKDEAEAEKDWFIKTFSQKQTPTDIPKVQIGKDKDTIMEILKVCFAGERSNGDIRRLLEQNAISIGDKTIADQNQEIDLSGSPVTVKAGKTTWFEVSK
ncbi:MAG: tyrosine--tRNA ligase [Candidatus Berkelbacteria bacterium]